MRVERTVKSETSSSFFFSFARHSISAGDEDAVPADGASSLASEVASGFASEYHRRAPGDAAALSLRVAAAGNDEPDWTRRRDENEAAQDLYIWNALMVRKEGGGCGF